MTGRVFLIVLDSLGIGKAPDAARFGDAGSDTLATLWKSGELHVPNLQGLGLYNIQEVDCGPAVPEPAAAFCRLREKSPAKDTTVGHWEMAGLISRTPFPLYPQGFPPEIVSALEAGTGRRFLLNKPYSGTDALRDYGEEHVRTGCPILYTSGDSVLQIAAHQEVIPLEELYRICETARGIMQGEHAVGRIIARPFLGHAPDFQRTANRHDYSLPPPRDTVLDRLKAAGFDVIGVGKIGDIFAGKGLTRSVPTKGNDDGMDKAIALAGEDFRGLCFVNLVDFDSLYGHRNDVPGYTRALNQFDRRLGELLPLLRREDALIITADHGCDPSTPSTDHSRECVPMLMAGAGVRPVDLGVRESFADIAATVQEWFGLKVETDGASFYSAVGKGG